jgi:hypothetical protein
MYNGTYRIALPAAIKSNICNVVVESFLTDDVLMGVNYDIRIRELASPDAFCSGCQSHSDIVLSMNSRVQQYTSAKPLHAGVQVPSYMLQNGTLNVRFTAQPNISMWEDFEYPPAAMTANSTTISTQGFRNGLYVASVSSAAISTAFAVFNKSTTVPNATSWTSSFSAANQYAMTTGLYIGTASNGCIMNGAEVRGEHVTITLPHPIVLSSYSMSSTSEWNNRNANTWVLGGSDDGGNTWTILDFETGATWTSAGQTQTFVPPPVTQAFDTYRIVCLQVGNNTATNFRNGWGLSEWRLFGKRPYFSNWSMTLNISDSNKGR